MTADIYNRSVGPRRHNARPRSSADLGYVVIDRDHSSEALVEFATRVLNLQLVDRDGAMELYVAVKGQ